MNDETLKIFKLNSECENALIDFPFHDNETTWIQEHRLLFIQTQSLHQGLIKKEIKKSNFIQQFEILYLSKK